MDKLSPAQRSKCMKAIKYKDSLIEVTLRKSLWNQGYRYRKNYSKLPGKPDIALTKYKIAIFCDSEFWHGYDWETRKTDIKSNQLFWINKIERNIERDKEVNSELEKFGWKVIRFWGRDIKKELNECLTKIAKIVEEVSNGEKNNQILRY
ncbi:very short patch repair endonuclease [Dehalococcoides mccartyi]|jgi:T/G mismatch-specific endonuclease (EC 3.1.-.-)|uniref:very short patch repair endonuclease n=1 Tax=Dehalococcoides mccartyi TaxID=61435 RepID=UPI00098EABBC|nr:very short patch repair endonuclease [Dehalococcoides mccartyi]AQU05224.1 very short patch repair endonuclease [Dehalococcoides mccartyi]AQU06676.1 very short patch repair endonuclease [Dehalococcoides mccartyi]